MQDGGTPMMAGRDESNASAPATTEVAVPMCDPELQAWRHIKCDQSDVKWDLP